MPPIIAVMTASQRTILRTCFCVVPIARSIPISRVRSLIESTSVLTIPNSEIRTASESSDVDQARAPG